MDGLNQSRARRSLSSVFSISFSHAFLQAGMLIPDKGLLTKVKQHFVAANQGKGGALLYRARQSAEGLLLRDQAYHPLFPENTQVYSGVMDKVGAHTHHDVVIPDDVGNIPLCFPYGYQVAGQQEQACLTPMIDCVNHGKQAWCGPHFSGANCQVVFAGGNLDQPLVAGVCAQSGEQNGSNTRIRQTQYILSNTHALVMTNQKAYRNHLTFTVRHQNRQTTTCQLNGDIHIHTPKNYQHHITDKLDERLTEHHQRMIET